MSDAPTLKFEKDGKYKVCSAYCHIMNANIDAMQHRVAGHWNLIWNLKLPAKVKNFLWRVCRNYLSPYTVKIAKPRCSLSRFLCSLYNPQ